MNETVSQLDANILAHEMMETIRRLELAYREEETANQQWAEAEERAQLAKAKAILTAKAKDPKLSGIALEAISQEQTFQERMEVIQAETKAKRAKHDCAVLEKQLDVYRSLFALERVKLERSIHLE